MRPNPASSCVADVTSLLTSELFSSLVYVFFQRAATIEKCRSPCNFQLSLKVTKTIRKGVKGLLFRVPECLVSSDGQTPWPHGRPSDTDNISTTGRNFRNIVFFREKFRKGVHQNIDQKADIWSEPSQGSKFWRKKNISTMNFLDVEM